jgi:hypothetical protein
MAESPWQQGRTATTSFFLCITIFDVPALQAKLHPSSEHNGDPFWPPPTRTILPATLLRFCGRAPPTGKHPILIPSNRPLSVAAMSNLHSHKPIGSVLQRQPFLVFIVIVIRFIPVPWANDVPSQCILSPTIPEKSRVFVHKDPIKHGGIVGNRTHQPQKLVFGGVGEVPSCELVTTTDGKRWVVDPELSVESVSQHRAFSTWSLFRRQPALGSG